MNKEIRSVEDGDSDLTSYFDFALARMSKYYRLLLVLVCGFFVLVVVYVHTTRPVYMAVAAITSPKDALTNSAIDGVSSISSITRKLGFGGAASGDSGLFDQYTRILRSYRLAGDLAERGGFLALVFPDRWDPQTKQLRPRGGFVADTVDGIKGLLGLPVAITSPEDQIFQMLENDLSVSVPQSGVTDITEVSLRFNDPVAAEKILTIILQRADDLMRADRRADITARIAYLQDQLTTTTQGDQRAAIISILTVQQNTMMMISADHNYANNIVEPPHTPTKPIWPNAIGVFGLALFLAFATWVGAILLLSSNNRFLAPFASDRRHLLRRQESSAGHNALDAKSVPH